MALRTEACRDEAAEVVHRLTRDAFREQAALDPPSGAGREDIGSLAADLAAHGGAVAWDGAAPVGCLRFGAHGGGLYVRRVAVTPAERGRGIGAALMAWAEDEARARGAARVVVEVRLALPGNLAFYRRLGYVPFAEHAHAGYDHPTSLELRKALR